MTERRMVFVVEDDRKIATVMEDYLRRAGYEARLFSDGRAVVNAVRQTPPSAVILDRMLPVSDGMTICGELREFSSVPILMLTARVALDDRLAGLAHGADDYVSKPFSAVEVVARVDALIRRAEGRLTKDVAAVPYAIDDIGQRVAWHGMWLELSTSEYRILAAMMKQPGRVFSRDQLLDLLGERALTTSDRAIDSHVKNIRRKIVATDPHATCIISVYGSGYRFVP